MPPENINDFFPPVSTGTNPHQKIDDLILLEELNKIAKENMMYGAMTQFQPDVHAPTVTPFALDAELAPLKAMGWLLGKGKGIKDVLRHSKRTIYDLLNLDVPGFFSVQPYARKNPKVNPMGKWIDMDTSSRLAQDVAEDLPDVGYIEGKAKELEEFRDYFKHIGSPGAMKKLEEVEKLENLRPGAGLTEPYHISYPHTKSGSEVIPFDPIEVQRAYDMTEKGGKEFIAKYGEEAWQKEVSKYAKTQEYVEDLRMEEVLEAYETIGNELTHWTAEQAAKRNISIDDAEAIAKLIGEFPHINEYIKADRIIKELESRGEITWEHQKTLRDIFEGKPY